MNLIFKKKKPVNNIQHNNNDKKEDMKKDEVIFIVKTNEGESGWKEYWKSLFFNPFIFGSITHILFRYSYLISLTAIISFIFGLYHCNLYEYLLIFIFINIYYFILFI